MSILRLNKIQNPSGTDAMTINESTSEVTFGVNTGKILQVQTENTTIANKQITSTSFVTTEISINITPKYENSKILISASFNCYKSTTNSIHFTIYKNSTNLGHSTYGMQEFSGLGAAGGVPVNLQIVNLPNTTSQVTYTVYAKVNTGNIYVQSNSVVGNITATEIGV